MSKQKLAEMVLQKMKEKKQLEERNRPHHQVLQLIVRFQIEHYNSLSDQIQVLKKNLQYETELMETLNEHCMELENTGKKPYPRIIINPDFIASENIKGNVKQFYRKASNTFLREDILKRKKYDIYEEKISQIKAQYSQVKSRENQISRLEQNKRKTTNKKRQANLRQDLRLRSIKEEQQQIKQVIQDQIQSHKDLLSEYELKKGTLQNRMNWSEELSHKIVSKKQLIQKTYNPITYRNYLKRVFGIRTKNQMMQKNLFEVVKQVGTLETQTTRYQQFLQANNNLFIQGKCSDSPSKKKRGRSHSKFSSPAKKAPIFSDLQENLPRSRVTSQFKTAVKTKGKFDRTASTSLGRTATSSMTNLLKDSSRNRRSVSRSTELVKNFEINQ